MFKQKLRPYQRELCSLMMNGRRVINAAETGLGKTVMVLAAAEKLKQKDRVDACLIFCLASLKEQWIRRIQEFTDSDHILIDGNPKVRKEQFKKAFDEKPFYIVLNYEQVFKHITDLWKLSDMHGRKRLIIACDEITRIKNYKSKTARRMKSLRAKYMWALTATPVEDRPEEVHSICEWVKPGFLGSYSSFAKEYINENNFGGIESYKHLKQLNKILSPILGVKTQEEVADQLPKLITKTYKVDMKPGPLKVYRRIVRDVLENLTSASSMVLERLEDAPVSLDELRDAERESEKMRNAIQLKFLALRQLCCAPRLVHLSASRYAQGLCKEGVFDGVDTTSAKIDTFHNIMDDILTRKKNKVVVFSFFTGMLDIARGSLSDLLDKYDCEARMFVGSTKKKERVKAQDEFNKDPKTRILFCSDAGGYGIDLPGGNFVINLDLPWNPGKYWQRNRIRRIGSKFTSNTIINLIVRGTIEERMHDLIVNKQDMVDAIISGKGKKKEFTFTKGTLKEFLSNTDPGRKRIHKGRRTKPREGRW